LSPCSQHFDSRRPKKRPRVDSLSKDLKIVTTLGHAGSRPLHELPGPMKEPSDRYTNRPSRNQPGGRENGDGSDDRRGRNGQSNGAGQGGDDGDGKKDENRRSSGSTDESTSEEDEQDSSSSHSNDSEAGTRHKRQRKHKHKDANGHAGSKSSKYGCLQTHHPFSTVLPIARSRTPSDQHSTSTTNPTITSPTTPQSR